MPSPRGVTSLRGLVWCQDKSRPAIPRSSAKYPKRGDRYLRALLVQAAWVVLVKVKPARWARPRAQTVDRGLPGSGCITTCWQSRSPTSLRASPGVFLPVVEPSRRASLNRSRIFFFFFFFFFYLDLPAEVCERMRRDGGSVFPAHANTGNPNGPLRPVR